MALPMGSRLWRSALRFSPIYLLRPQCQHRGLLRLSPTGSPFLARKYSADPGPRRVVVVGVPNPLIWCRSRVYFFLIRAYFDRDFSIEEFTEGAKQAFTLVSKLLSQCNFDALENLVTSEVKILIVAYVFISKHFTKKEISSLLVFLAMKYKRLS
ncbi:hypothetical protein FKM82_015762 [Ascaphus truei]